MKSNKLRCFRRSLQCSLKKNDPRQRTQNVPLTFQYGYFLESNKNVLETFYLVSYLWVIDE